jgi:hypothetical protein
MKLPRFGSNFNRKVEEVEKVKEIEAGRHKRTCKQKLMRLMRLCGAFFLQNMLFFEENSVYWK